MIKLQLKKYMNHLHRDGHRSCFYPANGEFRDRIVTLTLYGGGGNNRGMGVVCGVVCMCVCVCVEGEG